MVKRPQAQGLSVVTQNEGLLKILVYFILQHDKMREKPENIQLHCM